MGRQLATIGLPRNDQRFREVFVQNSSLRFCRHFGVRFALHCSSNTFKEPPKLILFSPTKRFLHLEVSRHFLKQVE